MVAVEISVNLVAFEGRQVNCAFVRDIRERKQAEQTLREERTRLRSLVDVMDAMETGITIQDRDYTIIHQNKYMQKLTADKGIDGGVGHKCYELYEGNDDVCPGCPVALAFVDGQAHRAERAVPMPDGGVFYAANTAQPIRDANGEITACFEVVSNVTDRKWVEKGLELLVDRQGKLNRLQQDLLGPGRLDEKLRRITDAVVDIFGADFCRIWVTRPGDLCETGCMHAEAADGPPACQDHERCLWLMASSGRYTHADGGLHRRVPYGHLKVGRLAAGTQAYAGHQRRRRRPRG